MLKCTGSSCPHAVSPGCKCGCGGGRRGALARLGWAAALTVSSPKRTPEQNEQVGTAKAQRELAKTRLEKQEKTRRSQDGLKQFYDMFKQQWTWPT